MVNATIKVIILVIRRAGVYPSMLKKIITCRWYNHFVLPDLQINDELLLRKPHPCGGLIWKVVRLGADIGLECQTCKHRVLLTRRELSKRIKKNLSGDNHGPCPGLIILLFQPTTTQRCFSCFQIPAADIALPQKPSSKRFNWNTQTRSTLR